MSQVRPLVRAFQRFVVEQVRDTRRSVLRRPPLETIDRPRLTERVELWWASQRVTARLAQLEAKARRLTQRVRR